VSGVKLSNQYYHTGGNHQAAICTTALSLLKKTKTRNNCCKYYYLSVILKQFINAIMHLTNTFSTLPYLRMKQIIFRLKTSFLFLLLTGGTGQFMMAQQLNCNYKAPIVNIDFGTADTEAAVDLSSLKNYRKAKNDCPDDGRFALIPYTINCFGSRWHSLPQDHTPNDANGKMMVVNAAEKPGTFFQYSATGLTPGSMYEFSAWLVNICSRASGCTPTPPSISITIQADNGKLIGLFETGLLLPSDDPKWQKFNGQFRMPAGTASIILSMDDITNGGCGNDFAMDDIIIRECILEQPPAKAPPKPEPLPKPSVPQPKPLVKETPAAPKTVAEKPVIKTPPPVNTLPEKKPAITPAAVIEKPVPVPKAIATRANPVIKQVVTEEAELVIDLYDNGEIDGDTVSIYHNNQLIVSRAGLSANAVTVKIKVDRQHPHHELVMVANNLGSIPPNTSLMVITANKKRYEVFISASDEKNAKIVIDLQD
jgi:hypothetical protein